MKKQIKFIESETAYRFESADQDRSFELCKSDLSFSSTKFYECFFKGLEEIPEYELIGLNGKPGPQTLHVYKTVEKILAETCKKLDASWFVATAQDGEHGESAEESADQHR